MRKESIKQKIITAGFGLALFLIGGSIVLAYWNLTTPKPVVNWPNPMWIVAIANSFSLVLLGWVYSQLRELFANSQGSEEALRSLFLIETLHPEDRDRVLQKVEQILKQGGDYEDEFRIILPNGNIRWLASMGQVFDDKTGRPESMAGLDLDSSDRKRAEEMRQALEREQALSELRLRFFSMASHEFRTPLSTILLTAQILESSAEGWSEEKRKRNLNRIVSAAKEMRQMLDDILTINRAETGRLEFAPAPIELNGFCRQLLEELRLSASPQHTLTFSNQSEDEWASVDEKILRYILTNLLLNAIKYSPDGGEVGLRLTRTQEAITFQVNDRGIGIGASDIPDIFEAFHRGKNVDCISGSGLGLTVAKKCVELHGGSITFTSEVGVGTTFTVTIPCA